MSEETTSKVILITGAGTGIGKATALDLAPGNEIIIHYNSSADAARAVADEVAGRGGKAHTVQADVSSEAGCRALADAVKGLVPRLDVLVNNAGGMIRRQSTREFEWSLMEEVFALNTFSALLLTSLCLPLLDKGRSPCVINLTTIAMRHGGPSAILYAASKGALDSATRGMAKELAPKIRVNAVAPGVVETPFHEKMSTPERMAGFAENTPLKRNGKPAEVAHAIRFLVEAEFLTGETVDVNGGLFMH